MYMYRGDQLLLTTFDVTNYVTETGSQISVEGTVIIPTSMPNLHWQESPYLIFLEVVRNFLQSWSTIFPDGVAGVVRQQIHGNIHTLPPTRSTPKPHVPKLIWGVLSLFLTPVVGFLVVFVLNLRFECGGLAIAKASLRCWEKKYPGIFSRPVAHIGGFYRPKPNLHWQESPYFIF